MTEQNNQDKDNVFERQNVMVFDRVAFSKLVINDLSKSQDGRSILKRYKQSEVREVIENYKRPINQDKLREISQLLYAKSPHYQRLISYFAGMALFSHIIAPIKDISKASKNKVLKQYIEIGELVNKMNLRHEMIKALKTAFREDVFYGYLHRDKKSFYIQQIDASICKITSIEDGIYNYSINMMYFYKDENRLLGFAQEIQEKYSQWKAIKVKNVKVSEWVELEAKNTICLKVNEEMLEVFPPFAGIFDAIYDIEGFKRLRKDKEELGNYMILTQELPIRKDSDNNNDFMIDRDMMMFFHNMASETVPDNVGVITSPMPIKEVKFDKERADSDGVAKAERDFWSGSGTSQLLFNADKSTSQGLLMSIKTDEEIVFGVLTQIERWLNRYLKFEFSDLMFNVSILHVTVFNRQEMYKMYVEAGTFGLPVKNHLCATIGLSPIETMNMAYLENDILELHTKFIPLISSHTMPAETLIDGEGRPKKDSDEVSDETARSQDKPNA